MQYILALDQGTTSSRAMVFDRAGHIVSSAQQEFPQIFPQPGWVEHDACAIWATQLAVARQALHRLGAVAADLAGVGITNQRETTVLWDRATGQPVCNAIVWQDRRTAARCDALRAQGKGAAVLRKTGLMLDAYFSATKLEWMLDHIPGARQRAERGELAFGTVDSWLVWNLTGGRVHVTDASNASRTLLFNIHTLRWDELLPTVVPSSSVLGETDAAVLGAPIAIAGMAGDQQAASFGQACLSPGMAKNTYGTGCFMLMNTGTAAVPSASRLLTTVAWVGPETPTGGLKLMPSQACYALEGSVFMGGATIQWLRDGLQIIASADAIEPLARSVSDVQDVYLVPAFTGLGAPYWDGFARGTLVGLTRGTTRAHIARAALEAIALQSANVFAAMVQDSGIALQELRVDGGASRNDLLMQMQADFLGVPVVRPKVTETTALGAAYLAGLATGFWADAEELRVHWAMDKTFVPELSDGGRTDKLARWQQAIDRSRVWAAA
ncbi:MAG: glycerol kinase [Burkholderiales bacterium PBB4]|nr:MAG: glycerol kinase [Burkholderiales bacterium PBB4]